MTRLSIAWTATEGLTVVWSRPLGPRHKEGCCGTTVCSERPGLTLLHTVTFLVTSHPGHAAITTPAELLQPLHCPYFKVTVSYTRGNFLGSHLKCLLLVQVEHLESTEAWPEGSEYSLGRLSGWGPRVRIPLETVGSFLVLEVTWKVSYAATPCWPVHGHRMCRSRVSYKSAGLISSFKFFNCF